MVKYFTATEHNEFPESILVGSEFTIYDRPMPRKTVQEGIGPKYKKEIPAFSINDLEIIEKAMVPHYENVWICINRYHDLIGCIGFNEKIR